MYLCESLLREKFLCLSEHILRESLRNLDTTAVPDHGDDDDSDLLRTHSTQHGQSSSEKQVDFCEGKQADSLREFLNKRLQPQTCILRRAYKAALHHGCPVSCGVINVRQH